MAYDWTWVQRKKKNGQPGVMFDLVRGPEYTKINKCALCGKLSTPKKVQNRNDVYGWNGNGPSDYKTESKDMLCMGCYNKIRPLHKRQRETNEVRILINKLKRTISHERKQNHQNDRRASGLSRNNDVGG